MCSNRYINNSFNNNTTNFDDRYGLPTNWRYGSAYVPIQTFRTVFSPSERIISRNYVS